MQEDKQTLLAVEVDQLPSYEHTAPVCDTNPACPTNAPIVTGVLAAPQAPKAPSSLYFTTVTLLFMNSVRGLYLFFLSVLTLFLCLHMLGHI